MPGRSRRLTWWPVCLLAVVWQCMTAIGLSAQEQNEFAAATTAFERGDYGQALELFERARAQGRDGAALRYNIGVCQYRLGAYTAAEASFRGLGEQFPSMRPIADYNRGLALLALARAEEARAAFERARAGGDANLAALATEALAQTATAAAVTRGSSWLGYFDAGLGHDDNVALVDELSLPADLSPSSSFSELLGFVSRRFDATVPARLDLSGYLVRYADAPEFDQEAFRAAFLFDATAGAWRLSAGPQLTQTTLDGDGFERAIGAQLQARRQLSDRLALDLRFLYDDIDSPTSRYDFISGSRTRARATLESRPRDHRLRISYEHEWNDRSDARVSPQRDRLALDYRRALSVRWSLDGDVSYRRSRYDDLVAPRRERLFDLGATARRALGSGWLLNLEYRWLDNDATAPQFSYRSHRATIGFGKNF